MRTAPHRRSSGYVLLVAIILLAILTGLGIAAVRVSGRDREGAGNKSKFDRLTACARAAQAKIWSEVATYGSAYLSTSLQPVTAITLPDGTQLAAPAHYDTATDGTVHVREVTLTVANGAGGPGLPPIMERANKGPGPIPSGSPIRVVARCTDSGGRTYEVELGVRFAL